ncbi:MAG: acyltransferase family protein [Deltaproteobacteria bacterium]|nr:acyltransferase family protein [Deltaproteobacteria bacterium]
MLGAALPSIAFDDAGHGYDRFGLSPSALRVAFAAAWPLYRYYFRVASVGAEHVPKAGAAIVVANHSGMLPFDGMMLCMDVAQQRQRALRPLADHAVGALPFIGVAMQRIGAVSGTSTNARALLEAGEILLVFPEGVPGISKPARRKYRLTHWRPGHAELALRHKAPIIPAAVVGAEEQFPIVHNSKRLGRLVGAPHVPLPFLPVPFVPVPLPVKYRIYYGEPIVPEGDANDPSAVEHAAWQTQNAVQALIARGLRERRGSFW